MSFSAMIFPHDFPYHLSTRDAEIQYVTFLSNMSIFISITFENSMLLVHTSACNIQVNRKWLSVFAMQDSQVAGTLQ